eukprot:TRINITY_DN7346_c0_g1_i1.p1 TRINITY_DN7346_c0_g1~~TRINITY_DN7346_c0_g1_i1.p1  ORF type:complete len:377 (+),score=52.91 TRINITY_DN7346_c0_g1_i1:123-1133(+)
MEALVSLPPGLSAFGAASLGRKQAAESRICCQKSGLAFSELQSHSWQSSFSRSDRRWRFGRRWNNVSSAAAIVAQTVESKESALQAPPLVRPTPAELARTVTELCSEGTLATSDAGGWPLGTFIQFALDLEGNPVLRLDPNAAHSQHLESNRNCSIFVQLELPGRQKILCTLKGQVSKPSDQQLQKKLVTAWQRRFGEDPEERELHLFTVEQVLQAGNMGRGEVWVPGAEYSAAIPDPLRECAATIVSDFNRSYWEDLRRFCSAYADIQGEQVKEARMTWVDRLGFDMHVLLKDPQEIREVRLPFPREVKDDRDARSSLTMMAQLAWEKERHYVAP